MTLQEAVKYLVSKRRFPEGKPVSMAPMKPEYYAKRIGINDNLYTFVISHNDSNPLNTLAGSRFELAPDDLNAEWEIIKIKS